MKIKFGEKALDALRLPPDKRQLRVWDTAKEGLGVVLTKRVDKSIGATYVLNIKRPDGKWRQESLGTREELSYVEACKKVTSLLGNVVDGKLTPGDNLRLSTTGPTFREAVESKLAKMLKDGARPSSMKSIRNELLRGRHLVAWHDRPLRSITPWDCRAMHETIALAGKHAANRILINVGAVWAHVARECVLLKISWPDNPTAFVEWFSKPVPGFRRRRKDPILWAALPAWKARVDALRNRYHVLLHYVTLLTALRKFDALTMRWEHMNLTAEPITITFWSPAGGYQEREIAPSSVFRPCPKGGHVKAFDVPLPKFLVRLLTAHHAKRNGETDNGWVFPGKKYKDAACDQCADLNLPGHVAGVVCHMTHVDDSGESPHRERDTYIKTTPSLNPPMPEGIAKRLVDHASGGDVTEDYRTYEMEELAYWQEKQCAFLLARMKGERHLRSVA